MKHTDQRHPIHRSGTPTTTIQQPPAGSYRTKNLDTHHGITIKWSPGSGWSRVADAARAAVHPDAGGAGTAGGDAP